MSHSEELLCAVLQWRDGETLPLFITGERLRLIFIHAQRIVSPHSEKMEDKEEEEEEDALQAPNSTNVQTKRVTSPEEMFQKMEGWRRTFVGRKDGFTFIKTAP